MKIHFLGVGDACDGLNGNTSILVTTYDDTTILFDCGFSVPHALFHHYDDPDTPDMVWISHLHGDHCFGIPLLLLRLWEMGRRKPLLLIGNQHLKQHVHKTMELAYPGIFERLSFQIFFQSVESGQSFNLEHLIFRFASTVHFQPNLGILLEDGKKKIYYSGDGRPTEEIEELVRDCDLAIHESFMLRDEIPNHGSVAGSLELAEKANIKQLALVHLDRTFRVNGHEEIQDVLTRHPTVFLPANGHSIVV